MKTHDQSDSPTNDLRMISISRVADILGVSASTVRRMIRGGELNAPLVHGQRRIRLKDLRKYIENLEDNSP